jgi:hypothetical protein
MQQNIPRERRRTRIVRPYPIHTLEDVLDVARAIQESNAGLPFDRELLARALGTTPASSSYTMRLNSSAKYGLTQGAYNDERISLTPRGEAIAAPRGGNERRKALMDAALQPDIFRRFYEMLDSKRLPEDTYARNVLQRELGVHPDLTVECLEVIKANGLYAGLLKESGGHLVISLRDAQQTVARHVAAPVVTEEHMVEPSEAPEIAKTGQAPNGKVFVSYSGDPAVARFVISVLEQFGIPYGGVDATDDDKSPIPAQVVQEMRSSSAAILVLASSPDSPGESASGYRDRMLYQLGAASVLYGDRIVVFSESGLGLGLVTEGLHSVEFERGRHTDAGLSLLRGLHRAGIINIGV